MEFVVVLIPIFFIFGIGFVGEKLLKFDTKPLSMMAIYLMLPFLAFETFYSTDFSFDYLMMAIYTIGLAFCLILVIYGIAFLKRYSLKKTCGMILASAFMNNGNYGTPLIFFAFGESGLRYAVILMVIQQLLMCTVGIYYAAKGSPNGGGVKIALKEVVKVPIVYGALLGIVLHFSQIPIEGTFMEAISMVGNAAVPTIMIILGMQLAKISVKKLDLAPLSLSLGIRLFLSPVIAFAFTLILPIDDLLKQIMIVLSAMPTAANTTMYALKYDTEPQFVSSATLFSTVLSVITLPIVLYVSQVIYG
ncbi:AEC family transporter [Metabacillus halosaccharovorans]|uniref:AEC family transporter n=1 Tax=Metabacillus halosaccharovorans TaxID=930124 RepID=A0ABT3DBV7_9BACI|nr:AEC family transporter [Metabacillus halosaccharovorans]MCV9884341.1 AEC family transporter [Metabacillus halosaccharovorans]